MVDDDASVRDALVDYLGSHSFRVRGVDGAASLDWALLDGKPDLVVLDVMLPGEDGLSICKRLGTHGVPVLMLSALGSSSNRIAGLEGGADDYLAKPFEPRELLARVRSILKRESRDGGFTELRDQPVFHAFLGWKMNQAERSLEDPAGSELILTPGEFSLLCAFVVRPRRLLSRSQLQDLVLGPGSESFDRAIDLAVSRLRRKLAERDRSHIIETVRGEGYRFCPKVTRS